jgi:ribosomal protein L11 methyltransferase
LWVELKISLPDDLKEPVTAVIYEKGCIGVQEEDGALTAYFPADAGTEEAEELLLAFKGVSVVHGLVEEQDWYAPWKETIKPVHASGLVICPLWRACGPSPGEKPLVLDPAQAFGAGDHVTTITVLEMLKKWVNEQVDLRDKKFLDVGTGTGILAIAALIYGFEDITAVDVEQSAHSAATRNFMLNNMAGRARIILGGIKEAGRGFDLIAANLFQEALLEVIPDAAAALNPGGGLIISGLLSGQEGPVFKEAVDHGLEVIETVNSSGWVSARLFLR